MHELTLVSSLVDQVEEILEEENEESVKSITIILGGYAGVDRQAFEFAFSIGTENSCLEGASLFIEEQPLEVTCRSCSSQSMPEALYLRCQYCGSAEVDIIQGRDFMIKSLEFEKHSEEKLYRN